MSDTDRVEWRLIDTDLVTQLAILPAAQSHLYLHFQETGSGEVRIPLDSTVASSATIGRFCMMYYRGAARGGFFIDNLKEIHADAQEGGGRWLSLSGRGPLGMLDTVRIAGDGSGESTRKFTATTKGAILNTLIQERVARGDWTEFNWSFTADQDSNTTAWTDNADIEITVGSTLLDVLRDFASTGDFEFNITFVSPDWTLNCYQAGIGTDKSESVYFRIGMNAEEVSKDILGTEIINAYVAKFRDGYITAEDATSITAYGRREGFLNLDVAQSGASAQTFASGKLSETKDPLTSISIRVYDGIAPYLFVNYVMGDTVMLDRFGTETSYRVLGLEMDFDGDDYAHVVVTLNSLHYSNVLKMKRDLDWLMRQWNTARDANQQEIRQWMSIGQPNGEVYCLHTYGDYVYTGGDFTAITGILTTSYIARYQISTGQWSAMGSTITQIVRCLIDISGTIYAATTDKVYSWNGSAWSLIGTYDQNVKICSIATDGTNLYIGYFTNSGVPKIEGVNIYSGVAKWNGSVWTDISDPEIIGHAPVVSLAWYNSKLYAGRRNQGSGAGSDWSLYEVVAGGVWVQIFTSGTGGGTGAALQVVGDDLVILDSKLNIAKLWTGTGSTYTTLGTFGGIYAPAGDASLRIDNYLNDIIVGGLGMDVIDGTSGYNNVARYSGGDWLKLGDGLSEVSQDHMNVALTVGDDILVGGLFSTAGGKTISNLAIWVTSFESLIDHLSRDNGFDLAAAIHQATASAITDNDEMGFWEDTSNALRKITWANIKATLKTYFDTLYSAIGHSHTGSSANLSDFFIEY